MSPLRDILILAAIFLGLWQIAICCLAYAMLRSGKFRSVKVGTLTGICSAVCAVLAVLLK